MPYHDEPTTDHGCPRPEVLVGFQNGSIPGLSLDQVAEHLEHCPSCAARLPELPDQSDSLISALRSPASAPTFPEEDTERLSQLIQTINLSAFETMTSGGQVQQTDIAHAETGENADGGKQQPAKLRAGLGKLGPYKLLLELGAGGMGKVYKAHHTIMNRTVAIKVIHQRLVDNANAIRRFHREIQALANLDHRNIVRAYDANQDGDVHFLVMEYAEGSTLSQVLRERNRLSISEACAAIYQAAVGLQHAHSQGLVHRDIKPSNLIRTPDGTVKVLDLGLALIQEEAADELTATGQMMGTLDYMAPEQWENTHQVDIRADIYSLGCTLFHLLAGKPPFSGPGCQTMRHKMKAHLEAPIPDIREARPEVPAALAELVRRMLEKNPEERFSTPGELAVALLPFINASDLPAETRGLDAEALRAGVAGSTGGRKTPTSSARSVAYLALAAMVLLAVGLSAGLLGNLSPWSRNTAPGGDTPAGPAAAIDSKDRSAIAKVTAPGATAKESGPSVEVKPTLPPAPKVPLPQITEMRVSHFRGNPAVHLGDFGRPGVFAALFDDDCRFFVRFENPAYFYLIALNANGRTEVCPEETRTEPPQLRSELLYPSGDSYFPLNDDTGYQAFVVVASSKPLPPYDQWRARAGAVPWSRTKGEGVWSYESGQGIAREPRERSGTRQRVSLELSMATLAFDPSWGPGRVPWTPLFLSTPFGPENRLQAIVQFFEQQPEFEAVGAVMFPVNEKSR